MHRATWLPVIIIASVVVGGLLYLYGSPAFHQSYLDGAPSIIPNGKVSFTILSQGDAGLQDRVNYRIQNADQLAQLWRMLYTDSGTPVPSVNFNRYEVLALFDGSHTTGGYGIQLSSVKDSGGQRTVTITHIAPADSCVSPGGITSPFVIVQVPKSSLPIGHVEQTNLYQCE